MPSLNGAVNKNRTRVVPENDCIGDAGSLLSLCHCSQFLLSKRCQELYQLLAEGA